MAYFGTTAASSVSNPPRLLVGRVSGVPSSTGLSTSAANLSQGGSLWYYTSTNLSTDLNATSTFFSDGWYLGMRAGDIVFITQFTSAGSSHITGMWSVQTASAAGCGFSTGGNITSTFA